MINLAAHREQIVALFERISADQLAESMAACGYEVEVNPRSLPFCSISLETPEWIEIEATSLREPLLYSTDFSETNSISVREPFAPLIFERLETLASSIDPVSAPGEGLFAEAANSSELALAA